MEAGQRARRLAVSPGLLARTRQLRLRRQDGREREGPLFVPPRQAGSARSDWKPESEFDNLILHPAFSPDGRYIVFSSDRKPDGGPPGEDKREKADKHEKGE